MSVLTNEQNREYWNGFADLYQDLMQQTTNIFYYTLFNIMQVKNAENVLEVACGTGIQLKFAIQMKKNECKYTACDISENMVNKSRDLMQQYEKNPFQDYQISEKICEQSDFQKFNLRILQANNEELNQFQNQSFDRYIANLSLHIVTNPSEMIKEAFRVLQSNGQAGFSVWGSQQNCTVFTIFSNILKQHNVKVPEKRSNFHLNDEKLLMNMIEDAGFIHVRSFHQTNPIYLTDQNIIDMYYNRSQALLENLSQEKKNQIKYDLLAEFQKISTNGYLDFEGLLVTATKP